MKHRATWQALAALAVVWSLVWAVSAWTTTRLPTAERLLDYLADRPFDHGDRQQVLDKVIADYQRLPFTQKRALREPEAEGRFTTFLDQLTSAEKERFFEGVLPRGFREFLSGLSTMSSRDRTRLLERSQRELAGHLPDSPVREWLEQADPERLSRLAADTGLESLLQALPIETRLQWLPMIEQMQNNARQLKD